MVEKAFEIPDKLFCETEHALIRSLCLMDENYMAKTFTEYPECMELILRILLDKPDLSITRIEINEIEESSFKKHYPIYVWAKDTSDLTFQIVFQKAFHGNGRHLVSHNSIILDFYERFQTGNFADYPESYVILITEKEVLGHGLPVYHISRSITETRERFDDKEHILYVNGAYRGDSPIGRLIHDFSCTDPEQMHYPLLADCARFFKETEKGFEMILETFDKLWVELWIEGYLDRTLAMVTAIMQSMKLSQEEVMKILNYTENEKDFVRNNIDIFLSAK